MTGCTDDENYKSPEKGYDCRSYSKANAGFCVADKVCDICTCTCEEECKFDACPYDADNDRDGDNICGDVDSCDNDKENDADSDSICGDKETCDYDAENDIDSD